MEWYIMNSSGVRSLTSGIGRICPAEGYKLADECSETLEDILNLMENDDKAKCLTRRHLLAENIVLKDLQGIIKDTQPDQNELLLTLRLLKELCTPPELCLLSHAVNDVRHDVLKLRTQVQSLFFNKDFVQSLFSHVDELIHEAGNYEMSIEAYLIIQNFLHLLRNVLHMSVTESLERRIALLGLLLLKSNLIAILLFSIHCHSKETLTLPAVQIITQLYKDFQWADDVIPAENGPVRLAAEKITNFLKCFIVHLLQGTLGCAVKTLKKLSLKGDFYENSNYLAWLLAYFLPQLADVPLPVEKLESIFSYKILGFLTYQAEYIHKQLRKATDPHTVALNISSISSVISAVDGLLTAALRFAVQANGKLPDVLIQFYEKLYSMSDLGWVILLYIRHFDFTKFPRSFLAQLVSINHNLLNNMELYCQATKTGGERMIAHVKEFACSEVMSKYGILLSTYYTNTETTNTAVFTMISHVCMDCNGTSALYQPSILHDLTRICDVTTHPSLCSRASEHDKQLAQYIIDSFLQDLSSKPERCIESFMDHVPVFSCALDMEEDSQELTVSDVGHSAVDWCDEAESELFSAYSQHSGRSSPVAAITSRLAGLGHMFTKKAVAQKLEECGLFSDQSQEESIEQDDKSDLQSCVDELKADGFDGLLSWIQNYFLTLSYMKANPNDRCCHQRPLIFYSHRYCSSVQILPYTQAQEAGLSDKRVRKLLTYMGLLSSPDCTIPEISSYLTDKQLFALAEMVSLVTEAPIYHGSSDSSASSEEEPLKSTSLPAFSTSGGNNSSEMLRNVQSDHNVWLRLMNSS